MFVDPILRRIQPSTNAWSCKWYWLICYISVVAAAMGVTVIPGNYGVVAITSAFWAIFFTTLMRDSNCKV